MLHDDVAIPEHVQLHMYVFIGSAVKWLHM
jgi:hypothetical protein